MSKNNNNNNNNNSGEELIYSTLSICVNCVYEDADKTYRKSTVTEENNQIWLNMTCEKHGNRRTLYCKNSSFFKKVLTYGSRPNKAEPEIEEIERRLRGKGMGANRPMLFSLSLYENNQFVSTDHIDRSLLQFQLQHTGDGAREGIRYIIKIEGKYCMDLERLNALSLYVTDHHKGVILIECSFDRLILMARLSNSVFKCSDVYPAVKYFLNFNEEPLCLQELQRLHRNLLAEFAELPIMCSLVIDRDRKYPDLREIISYLRAFPNFFRFIIFSLERTSLPLPPSPPPSSEGTSVDPYDFLEYFETQSSISPLQFIPGTSSLVMEPILQSMGFGAYSLKISPFCSFMVPLINTEEIISLPLGNYFNVEYFYKEILPYFAQLRSNNIGPTMIKNLTKIFKNSSIESSISTAEFISLLTSRNNEKIKSFSKKLQFIIVHNNMDISSVDMIRRCYCASAQPKNENSLASSCLGCI